MATWASLTGIGRSVKSVQTTSDSAPSAGTDGMSLQSVAGFKVTLEADSGQTLSGAGTLTCFTWDDLIAGWARYSDGDITVPAAVASNRRYGAVPFQVLAPRGRIAFITSGITVSGGSLTIYMIASNVYGDEV